MLRGCSGWVSVTGTLRNLAASFIVASGSLDTSRSRRVWMGQNRWRRGHLLNRIGHCPYEQRNSLSHSSSLGGRRGQMHGLSNYSQPHHFSFCSRQVRAPCILWIPARYAVEAGREEITSPSLPFDRRRRPQGPGSGASCAAQG
ncbi:hypothetical protein B0H13DRAFT_765348 [Mycena leptocephala]|nr:hypothetical protein B0H13DRAFT_765348 [Mycena leptocephala]